MTGAIIDHDRVLEFDALYLVTTPRVRGDLMSVLFYCPSGADPRLDVLMPKPKQSSSVYVVQVLEHKHKEAMHLE
jgi:hypothetical protein